MAKMTQLLDRYKDLLTDKHLFWVTSIVQPDAVGHCCKGKLVDDLLQTGDHQVEYLGPENMQSTRDKLAVKAKTQDEQIQDAKAGVKILNDTQQAVLDDLAGRKQEPPAPPVKTTAPPAALEVSETKAPAKAAEKGA